MTEPLSLVERLRYLQDKAERGVTYGYVQTIWREAADTIERQAKELAEVIERLERERDALTKALVDGDSERDRLRAALEHTHGVHQSRIHANSRCIECEAYEEALRGADEGKV